MTSNNQHQLKEENRITKARHIQLLKMVNFINTIKSYFEGLDGMHQVYQLNIENVECSLHCWCNKDFYYCENKL